LARTWFKPDLVLNPTWLNLTGSRSCDYRKIKFKTLSYFSSLENRHFNDHVYHAIHHKLTTNYHHVAPQNSQKPLQNNYSTTQKFNRSQNKKNNPPIQIFSSPDAAALKEKRLDQP
jgi:hypothetical protein